MYNLLFKKREQPDLKARVGYNFSLHELGLILVIAGAVIYMALALCMRTDLVVLRDHLNPLKQWESTSNPQGPAK
jgi:hypothetical protein